MCFRSWLKKIIIDYLILGYGRRRTLLCSPPRGGDRFGIDFDRIEMKSYFSSLESSMMNNNQSFSVCFMFIFLFFLKVSFLKSNSRVPSGFDRQNSRDNSSNFSSQQQLFDNNNSGSYLGQQQQDYFPYQSESNRYRDSTSPSSSNQASSSSSMKVDNFVFNVEGLSSPMWNCERVFNLLCLYGNVLCVSNELNLRENVRNSFLFR